MTEALPEEEETVKDEDDDMDFNDDSFADKKKKKKKKKVNVDDLDDGDADKVCFEWSTYHSGLDFKHLEMDSPSHEAPFDPQENEGEGDSADPWTGSDRDYLYDELLQVNFHNIAETCPIKTIYPDVGCQIILNQKLIPLLSESVWYNEGQEP